MIEILKKCISPIFIILFGFILYFIISAMLTKIFNKKRDKKNNNRYNTLYVLIKNIIKYFIIIVCGTMVLDHFGLDTKSIITSFGIVGLVTGLALQDLLKDIVAGVTIVLENQYAIGDIVTIDGFKGTVTSFNLKTTRIKSNTGEEKILANHLIVSVINHTHNNSLAIIDVGVSYDENLEKVEKVLNKLCTRLNKEIKELKGDVEVLGIEELASSSVNYRIVAPCVAGEQYSVQRKIRKEIKSEFDKNNISIPYSQVVIHNG